jgi:hypothetical protein
MMRSFGSSQRQSLPCLPRCWLLASDPYWRSTGRARLLAAPCRCFTCVEQKIAWCRIQRCVEWRERANFRLCECLGRTFFCRQIPLVPGKRSGYIEMLARQITEDLQAIRNLTPPGGSRSLVSKGISYGTIARAADGSWITAGVQGIAAPSLVTTGPANPPSLIIRPFHQAGNVVSIRQFSNNAFNHHHGIQPAERFGKDTDPDGDGVMNEMTRADMTAVSIFQATMAVPGRVIPNDREIEEAVLLDERRFAAIGCAVCHIPTLPLDRQGWIFSEPNPFNPAVPPQGPNLIVGQAPTLNVDLSSDELPSPRLKPWNGVVQVPAYTDLKLHDITTGLSGDPNIEPLDMNQPAGSPAFFGGNAKFLTRKLWGTANEPPFFHHGMFTTLRQAVKAHDGEAKAVRMAFEASSQYERDSIIEFLKTLQILPPGTRYLIVDEHGRKKRWRPHAERSEDSDR